LGAVFLSQQAAAPNADPAIVAEWRGLQQQFAPLQGAALAGKIGLFQGPYTGLVHQRLIEQGTNPFTSAFLFGWETLAYMLFGMAALKSGLFRGDWAPERYRKVALVGFALTVPIYALFAYLLIQDGFSIPMVFAISLAATTPFRPVMVIAYVALIILATRSGGALVRRIAAAGRAAFTNYLGTSILMTTFFYGYGLGFYGAMSRVELWIVVLAMWALMLLWSKPWLERFQYGPLEWLWRSLSRLRPQPMRRPAASAAAPSA
jgi:uncharacterized protein